MYVKEISIPSQANSTSVHSLDMFSLACHVPTLRLFDLNQGLKVAPVRARLGRQARVSTLAHSN